MSDFNTEHDPAGLRCPQCGAPVTRIDTAQSDAAEPQQVEFQCPNHHRTTVVLIETDDDDDRDAAV